MHTFVFLLVARTQQMYQGRWELESSTQSLPGALSWFHYCYLGCDRFMFCIIVYLFLARIHLHSQWVTLFRCFNKEHITNLSQRSDPLYLNSWSYEKLLLLTVVVFLRTYGTFSFKMCLILRHWKISAVSAVRCNLICTWLENLMNNT